MREVRREGVGVSLTEALDSADLVVANIQWRTLKAEVEKVSVSTAVGHGSVGPKARCNCSPQS